MDMESSTVLFENSRIAIRKSKEKGFTYCERAGVDSVAFLIFKREGDGFINLGVIKEFKPSLSDRYQEEIYLPTAFGGSQDKISREDYLSLNDDERFDFMLELAKQECKEESGYLIEDLDRCYFTGVDFLSSQMNQLVYNFAFDVTDLENTGTVPYNQYEAKSQVVWFYPDRLIKEVGCAKAKSIYVSLMQILNENLMEKEASIKAARVPFEPPLQHQKLLTELKTCLLLIPNNIDKSKRPKAREFYKELASFLESLGYDIKINLEDSSQEFDLVVSENDEIEFKFNKKYLVSSNYTLNEKVKSDIINLDLD